MGNFRQKLNAVPEAKKEEKKMIKNIDAFSDKEGCLLLLCHFVIGVWSH